MTTQKPGKNSKKMKLDLSKFKKSPKPAAKDGAKNAPLTRSQKIFRGPLSGSLSRFLPSLSLVKSQALLVAIPKLRLHKL